MFVPGLFLVLTGFCVLLAPRFVAGLLAALFIFMGVMLWVGGWKILQLKNKFGKVAKDLEGRIVVQGVNLRADGDDETLVNPNKKDFFFH